MNYFDEQELSNLGTSDEIMEAISELSKSKEEAESIWQEPGQLFDEIMLNAWALVDAWALDNINELYWGVETIRRDAKNETAEVMTVPDFVKKYFESQSEFCRSVGIHEQQYIRYKNYFVLIQSGRLPVVFVKQESVDMSLKQLNKLVN